MNDATIFTELFGQIGMSAIFVVFLYNLWKRLQDVENKKNELFEKSIKASEGMRSVLEYNTKILEKILEKLEQKK